MKVVALISGGKDSCFNMMQCVAVGHEIVALANLYPKLGKDELDSYMYQTVGHECIGYYADAMNLPLYRREILGDSKITTMLYEKEENDEVEDLYELLCTVLSHHPDVKGVSVGAILSDYQRIRVEGICARLGLTSLGYLWRRDQKELLREMVAYDVHAVLIKVAAIGLDPEKHLGKSLGEMESHLLKMNGLYDLHPCGEGGEYETLVLDCPLFEKKLVIDEKNVVIHSDDAFAPVGYLRTRKIHLEPKACADPNSVLSSLTHDVLSKQTIEFDASEFENCKSCVDDVVNVCTVKKSIEYSLSEVERDSTHICCENGEDFAVGGIRVRVSPGTYLEDEVEAVLRKTSEILQENSLGWANVLNIHLYVSDMQTFAAVNAVYGNYFKISPPSRVCVEARLPEPFRVQLDCLAFRDTSLRKCMHVQGISFWAPANIGPYSQAVSVNGIHYLAGVIGLDPSLMVAPLSISIDGKSKGAEICRFLAETKRSLASLKNVISALNVGSGSSIEGVSSHVRQHSIGGVCYVSEEKYFGLARDMWRGGLNEESCRDNILFVSVPKLPRNSLVEWQLLVSSRFFECTVHNKDYVFDNVLLKQSTRMCIGIEEIPSCLYSIGIFEIANNLMSESEVELSNENVKALSSLLNSFLTEVLSLDSNCRPFLFRCFYQSKQLEKLWVEDILRSIINSACDNLNITGSRPAIVFIPVENIFNNSFLGVSLWSKGSS